MDNHNSYLRPRCLNNNKICCNQPLKINSESPRSKKKKRKKKLLQKFSNSSSIASRRRLCFEHTEEGEKNFFKSTIEQEKRQNVDQASSTISLENQNETNQFNEENQKLTCSSTSNINTPFSLRKQIALAVQLSIDDYSDNSLNDINSGSNSPKISSHSVDYFNCSSSLNHKELDNHENSSFSSSNLLSVSSPIIATPGTFKKLFRNNKGETDLHLAAIRGDFVRLEHLLSNKKSKSLSPADQSNSFDYDINVQDFAGWTALHEACNRGHIQAARVLLNHGADVNAAASCGTTPLIDAASNGHNTIVKLLLEHGADPLQKDKHGMNAIDLALNNSIKSILNLYLQKKQQILPSSNDKEISTTNNCCNKSELDKFELIKIDSQKKTIRKETNNPLDNVDIKLVSNMTTTSISISSCVTTSTSSSVNSINLNQTTLMSTSASNISSPSIISSSSSSSSIENPNKNLSNNNTTNTSKKVSKQTNIPLIKCSLNAASSLEQNVDSNTEILKLSDDSINKSVNPSTTQLDFEPHLVETEPIKLNKPDDSSSNIQSDSLVNKISSTDQPANSSSISEYSNVASNNKDSSISHQLRGRKQRRNGGQNDKKKVKKIKTEIADSELMDLNKMDNVNKDSSDSNLIKNSEEKKANTEEKIEYSSIVSTTAGPILTTQALTNTSATISSGTSSSIATTNTTTSTGSISNEQMRVPPIRIVLPSSANCNVNNVNGSNQSGIIVLNSSNNAIASNSGSTNIGNSTGLGGNGQSSGGNYGEIAGATSGNQYLMNVQTHQKYPYVVSTSSEQQSQIVESNKNETGDSNSLCPISTSTSIYSSTSVTTVTTAASTHRITRSSQRVAQQKHYLDEIDSVSFGTRKKKNRGVASHGSSHTTALGHTSNSNLANNTINTSIASSYYNSSSLTTNNQSNNYNGTNGAGNENFDDNTLHNSSNSGNGNSNANLYNYVPERASSYRLYMSIREHVRERRKHMPTPKMTELKPQNFNNYLMNRCDYLLREKNIPEELFPTPPPAQLIKGSSLYKLFIEQEQKRYEMRIRHKVEQEKLILTAQQDTLRLYNRAEMYKKNQTMPLSVCTYLKDEELYNKLELETDHSNDNVIIAQIKAENPSFLNTGPSALTGCGKIRCNGRVFLSWKRDDEDKWNKIKNDMLNRQRMEAEALSACQRLHWQWKMAELEPNTPGVTLPNQPSLSDSKDIFVPTVPIVKDFDLKLN